MINPIIDLMNESYLHKRWYIEDIYNIIQPPIELIQFVHVVENGKLVGLGTWASMNDESLDAFLTGSRKLVPSDFNNGHNLVLVDVIAPHGHGRQIAVKMRQKLIELGHWGKKISYIRYQNGKRISKESVL
jgi:cytolysin-activating lysine-acyltransferase